MKTRRRYVLHLTPDQEKYAEQIAGACRAVWNTALEQRRIYRKRGAFIGYFEQCTQLADAKAHPDCAWLKEAPATCLQRALKDLDDACKAHGAWRLQWRSRTKTRPSFTFPDRKTIHVRRINKRWGEVRLPKIGAIRFRWTRAIGGQIRTATVLRDCGTWYVSFCVEDGLVETVPNGKSPVGVDRGVTVAVATSDGWTRDRQFLSPGEAIRLTRLQQRLARCQRGTVRRRVVAAKLATLQHRPRMRRNDFSAWTANRLTSDYGLVVVEDLKIANMTASAKGTLAEPGTNVRQKAGLNRAILDKGWGDLVRRCEYKALINGSRVVRVPAAYTSQTCNACGHVAKENRESQAVFRCVACKHQANADVNAAKNILGAGLALTGRGDLGVARSAKRQPAAGQATALPSHGPGIPQPSVAGGSQVHGHMDASADQPDIAPATPLATVLHLRGGAS